MGIKHIPDTVLKLWATVAPMLVNDAAAIKKLQEHIVELDERVAKLESLSRYIPVPLAGTTTMARRHNPFPFTREAP